jgi:signal transduction histidine kinase
MLNKLTLRSKGILFVSLFLALEMAIGIALTVMLQQAEAEAKMYEKASASAAKASNLLVTLSKAGTCLAFYAYTGQHRLSKQYDDLTRDLPSEVQSLNVVVAPQRKSRADKLSALVQEIFAEMNLMKHQIDSSDSATPFSTAEMRNKFQVKLMHVARELNDYVDEENTYAHQLDLNAAKGWRDRLQMAVYVLFAISAVGALVLMRLFVSQITSRIDVVTDNAFRLASNKSLQAPVRGNDEIAHLDKIFHQMAESLQEAERMKKDFVAMVSHDLKSPLTAIQGSLTTVAHGRAGAVDEQAAEILDAAQTELKRLTRLIADLLDADKLDQGAMQIDMHPCELGTIIWRSVSSVKPLAEQSHAEIAVGECEYEIIADEERMVQVLVNLLSNAIKYSSQGAKVDIEAVPLDSRWVEVRVCDNGRGIPDEQLEAVFERFHVVDQGDTKERGGTGLGLSIARQIVEKHGGTIGARSNAGAGSTFWFTVRRTDTAAGAKPN